MELKSNQIQALEEVTFENKKGLLHNSLLLGFGLDWKCKIPQGSLLLFYFQPKL